MKRLCIAMFVCEGSQYMSDKVTVSRRCCLLRKVGAAHRMIRRNLLKSGPCLMCMAYTGPARPFHPGPSCRDTTTTDTVMAMPSDAGRRELLDRWQSTSGACINIDGAAHYDAGFAIRHLLNSVGPIQALSRSRPGCSFAGECHCASLKRTWCLVAPTTKPFWNAFAIPD